MSFNTKLERYIKFIPPLYNPATNPFISALLQSWSISDAAIESAVQAAKAEIFVVTADGTYLNALGQNVGVERPATIGLSDAKFAQLIPALSYQPKQVVRTMYNILDVFWGPLYSRSNTTSLAEEPYNLGQIHTFTGTTTFQNGSLYVYGSGTVFTSQVQEGTYVKFASHPNTAFTRVSQVINDTTLLLSLPYSQANNTLQFIGNGNYYDPETLILNVDDGPSQVINLIPNLIQNPAAALASEIAATINSVQLPNATSQTITASVYTNFVLGTNYVNIRTNTPGSSGSLFITGGTANVFSYTTQDNGVNTIFVSNANADLFTVGESIVVGSTTVAQLTTTISSITPDSPVAGVSTITVPATVSAYLQEQGAYIYPAGGISLGFVEEKIIITMLQQSTIIYEVNPKEIIVRIPSTVPAVTRGLKGSAHMKGGFNGQVVSVNPSLNQITVNFETYPATANEFMGYTFSQELSNFVIISNAAGLNGVVLQLEPDVDISGINLTNGFEITSTTYPGSFLYDTQHQPFTVTAQSCQLSQVISKGSVFPVINVFDAGDIPDGVGYLVFDYGQGGQEAPVRYRGRPNNNTLLLDPSYTFQENHQPGEYINALLSPLGATIPNVDGSDYAVYVVGSADAEAIIEGLLESVKAAGVLMTFIITEPVYLWNTARPVSVNGVIT